MFTKLDNFVKLSSQKLPKADKQRYWTFQKAIK